MGNCSSKIEIIDNTQHEKVDILPVKKIKTEEEKRIENIRKIFSNELKKERY